jgi:hypothetical protein
VLSSWTSSQRHGTVKSVHIDEIRVARYISEGLKGEVAVERRASRGRAVGGVEQRRRGSGGASPAHDSQVLQVQREQPLSNA